MDMFEEMVIYEEVPELDPELLAQEIEEIDRILEKILSGQDGYRMGL